MDDGRLKRHESGFLQAASLPSPDELETIPPLCRKGTVLVFDELNCPELPGETLALREVFRLSRYAIRCDPNNPRVSYAVIN